MGEIKDNLISEAPISFSISKCFHDVKRHQLFGSVTLNFLNPAKANVLFLYALTRLKNSLGLSF